MKVIVFVFVALLLFASIVWGQTNRRVEFRELGLSFQPPEGWRGGLDGEFYLLGHTSISGMLVLSENTSKNVEELKAVALKGISEEGIRLTPDGDFKIRGSDRVEGFYEGLFNGSQVRVFSIGLINRLGKGMNISIVAEKGKFGDVHISEAEKLAKSVSFFRKIESPDTKFWNKRIAGKQLKYLKVVTNSDSGSGSSGLSDTAIIKLYVNGTFYSYSSSSNGYWGAGGSDTRRVRGANEGTYRIYSVGNRSFLELRSGGRTVEFELSRSEKDHTLLNGDRFAVLDINRP
ncbi:MAG: hypothetical protein HKN25_06305 [Pyrinomonadaceae bacterium]|nr:hypothetical protein [Pyrinomonadaceae bacterium]